MAIEITPKVKIKTPLWTVILGVFCIILVLSQLISYFYLDKLGEKIASEIQEKEKALVVTPSEKTLEDELRSLSQKIDEFSKLLLEHKKTLNVFSFLENICLPKVWFSIFNFMPEKGQLVISGQADSFVLLGQQVLALKQEPLIKNLNLSGISLGKERGIDFSLQLTLDPQIFK